jgi:hypothetical protein
MPARKGSTLLSIAAIPDSAVAAEELAAEAASSAAEAAGSGIVSCCCCWSGSCCSGAASASAAALCRTPTLCRALWLTGQGVGGSKAAGMPLLLLLLL